MEKLAGTLLDWARPQLALASNASFVFQATISTTLSPTQLPLLQLTDLELATAHIRELKTLSIAAREVTC